MTKNDRQERIDAAIAACTECGGRDFPKRSDCDGCTNAVDEEIASEAGIRAKLDPRDPDHSRSGIFVHHNCWKCGSGQKPRVRSNPNSCDYPRARND